jgi:hypothetical protein
VVAVAVGVGIDALHVDGVVYGPPVDRLQVVAYETVPHAMPEQV